jgi:hypothetical protein
MNLDFEPEMDTLSLFPILLDIFLGIGKAALKDNIAVMWLSLRYFVVNRQMHHPHDLFMVVSMPENPR